MNLDEIVSWILSHPVQYPGLHQQSQQRLDKNLKNIEAAAQFHLIFNALSQYIKEKLEAGKGVNLKNFGGFTFEVFSDLKNPNNFANLDTQKELSQTRVQQYRLRPVFVPDNALLKYLTRIKPVQEINASKSQHSIYQQGFQMTYCNYSPIAKSCSLSKELVNSSINAILQAIQDLTILGNDIVLNFGFILIQFLNKNLKYQYDSNITNHLNDKSFQEKMRQSLTPTENFWKQKPDQVWEKSNLSQVLQKSQSIKVQGDYKKTQNIQVQSQDLTTVNKVQCKSYF